MLRLLPCLGFAFAVVACTTQDDDAAAGAQDLVAHSMSPPQSPPVIRPGPGQAPETPFSPADHLPTTPIVVRDGVVRPFIAHDEMFDGERWELTTLNPGAGRPVSQQEAKNICARLDYGGKTDWRLLDEQRLLAMASKIDVQATVWSNVDYVMASGFTTVDPTSGMTDLRQMASTVNLGTGAFVSRDHEYSDPGAQSDFLCVRSDQELEDWQHCMSAPMLQRCMCLGMWFVPPRPRWECN